MAIVMNSVKNADAMFRHIAGGAVTPLLSNYEGQMKDLIRDDPRTIIVHSKMEDGEAATGETGRYIRELAEVYRRNPRYGFSESDKAEEIIRRVMNTVGRPGLPRRERTVRHLGQHAYRGLEHQDRHPPPGVQEVRQQPAL